MANETSGAKVFSGCWLCYRVWRKFDSYRLRDLASVRAASSRILGIEFLPNPVYMANEESGFESILQGKVNFHFVLKVEACN